MTSRHGRTESAVSATADAASLTPRRRTVVEAAAATAALAGPPAAALPARAVQQAPAFLHGVASGDPLPDGVLLWTRGPVVDQSTTSSSEPRKPSATRQVASAASSSKSGRSGSV